MPFPYVVVLVLAVGALCYWRGTVSAFHHVEAWLLDAEHQMRAKSTVDPAAIVELPGVQRVVRQYHLQYGGQ